MRFGALVSQALLTALAVTRRFLTVAERIFQPVGEQARLQDVVVPPEEFQVREKYPAQTKMIEESINNDG